MTKPYKSYQEQLAILESRGLVVIDREKALHALRHHSYYRLSAYHSRLWNREFTITVALPRKRPSAVAESINPDKDRRIYNSLVLLAHTFATIEPEATPAPTTAHLRSSNLSIKKEFSEAEQDRFMDESFEFMAKFFKGSLDELERRYPEIETTFKQIDANCFTARIYKNGSCVSKCSICHDNSIMGNGILYSHDETSRGNSFNEMLGIEVGDQTLSLKASGMPSLMRGQAIENFTQQGAAEHYWALLMHPLK